jgi:hypothetical protein
MHEPRALPQRDPRRRPASHRRCSVGELCTLQVRPQPFAPKSVVRKIAPYLSQCCLKGARPDIGLSLARADEVIE